ncbi:MAG TPA: Maf family protein, partial [Usitatibacter sp.]|nr:Maf family protein [Usitatibacter sp.]
MLASGSRYRRELLERLGLPFTCWAPEVDESVLAGERPAATCARLARLKALAGARRWPQAWIIGSDQVADVDGRAVSKPGTLD